MTLDFPQESELVKKSSKLDDKTRRQSSKPVDWENSEDAILSDSVRSHIRNAGNFGIFPNENCLLMVALISAMRAVLRS